MIKHEIEHEIINLDEHIIKLVRKYAPVRGGGGSGSGATTFLELTDTPSEYTGQGGKGVRVKSDVSGLEFYTISGSTDELVKISANDTTAGYLNGKLLAGTGISLTENNNGANETLTIASSVTQYTDALARASISETITGIDYNNSTGVFSLSTGYVIPTTIEESNWNTAYNWGDHSTEGYLTSETDPLSLHLDQTTPQTIINGRPVTNDGWKFGTTPTVGVHASGKLYWDATYKTLSLEQDDSVTLRIGQETQAFVYNDSGSDIVNGAVVYISGATAGGIPEISLAKADSETTSFVLGIVTSTPNIPTGEYGYVTIRGHVNDLDTSAWSVGDSLYLSETTAGALTNVAPSAGNYDVRVGRVMINDASTGRIYVNIRPMAKLTDLGDVTISSPITDQILRYNGTEWVNGAEAVTSAGAGVEFYFNGTEIIATGVNNDNHVETLSKTPWASAEDVETTVVNNNTVLAEVYLYDTALNRTSLTAGTWTFNSYCAVDTAVGITQILHNVMRVRAGSGTVTITGTGTSRTATASTGTPFDTALIDVGGTIDSDSYLQTPLGLYRITARTSDTEVTITVPTTYTNESAVAYNVHKRLFQSTTGEINNTATAPLYAGIQLFSISSVQSAFTVIASDKLAIYRFGTTTRTSDTNIYFAYGGTSRYSHVDTPLNTLHGNLAGLQGGTGSVPNEEYYHLSLAQHTDLTDGGATTLHKHSYNNLDDKPTIPVSTAVQTITFIIDGGGSAITTGIKGDLEIPFACTINAWTLLADTSGAIKVDVWKDTYANYAPTDADSITNSHEPEISASGIKAQDTDLADWGDVTIEAGETLRFNVDSCTSITRVTLSLKVTRT